MKRIITLAAVAALSLTFASIQPSFAKGFQSKSSGTSGAECQSKIDSGRDFGQHVRGMNDHFSGDHNPGKHHKGYSGLKD